jgi:hypothetical protein
MSGYISRNAGICSSIMGFIGALAVRDQSGKQEGEN